MSDAQKTPWNVFFERGISVSFYLNPCIITGEDTSFEAVSLSLSLILSLYNKKNTFVIDL